MDTPVIDEAARLWAASGLVPANVDERAVLRGLFELGIIAPGHKWRAEPKVNHLVDDDEEEQTPPPSPRRRARHARREPREGRA